MSYVTQVSITYFLLLDLTLDLSPKATLQPNYPEEAIETYQKIFSDAEHAHSTGPLARLAESYAGLVFRRYRDLYFAEFILIEIKVVWFFISIFLKQNSLFF